MKLLPLEQIIMQITEKELRGPDTDSLVVSSYIRISMTARWYGQPFRLDEVVSLAPSIGNSTRELTGLSRRAQEALLFEGWTIEGHGNQDDIPAVLSNEHYSVFLKDPLYSYIDSRLFTGYEFPPPPTRGQFISDCHRAGIELIATDKAEKELS